MMANCSKIWGLFNLANRSIIENIQFYDRLLSAMIVYFTCDPKTWTASYQN